MNLNDGGIIRIVIGLVKQVRNPQAVERSERASFRICKFVPNVGRQFAVRQGIDCIRIQIQNPQACRTAAAGEGKEQLVTCGRPLHARIGVNKAAGRHGTGNEAALAEIHDPELAETIHTDHHGQVLIVTAEGYLGHIMVGVIHMGNTAGGYIVIANIEELVIFVAGEVETAGIRPPCRAAVLGKAAIGEDVVAFAGFHVYDMHPVIRHALQLVVEHESAVRRNSSGHIHVIGVFQNGGDFPGCHIHLADIEIGLTSAVAGEVDRIGGSVGTAQIEPGGAILGQVHGLGLACLQQEDLLLLVATQVGGKQDIPMVSRSLQPPDPLVVKGQLLGFLLMDVHFPDLDDAAFVAEVSDLVIFQPDTGTVFQHGVVFLQSFHGNSFQSISSSARQHITKWPSRISRSC